MARYKHKKDEHCEFCRRKALAGARLRRFRRDRGLTQAQIGDLVGVSDHMISDWERGECLPSLKSAFYLAHVLNRQVIDLFFPIHDYVRQEVAHDQGVLPLDE